MRIAILIVSLVFTAFACGGVFLILRRPVDGADIESAADERLIELESRIARIERSLDAIDRLAAEVEALRIHAATTRPVGALASAAPDGASSAALETDDGKPSMPPRSQKVAAFLDNPDAEAALREFVADVYHEERELRKEQQREQAEERRRERQELAQGPYGEYNYRVNSLAKKLDMNHAQKENYYRILLGYADRRKAERKELSQQYDLKQPGMARTHFQQWRRIENELGAQLENDVLQILTAPQRETFDALPKHERRGQNAYYSLQTSLEGMEMQIESATFGHEP